MRWNSPPNWPAPPPGWTPPPGWQPDPAWGPPPPGHQFWVPEVTGPPMTGQLAYPPQAGHQTPQARVHQPGLQPGTYSPAMQPGGMEPLGESGKGKTWIVVALVVVLVLALGGLVGVLVLSGDDDETPVADNTEETSERTDSATTEPTDSATTEPTEHPSSDTPEGLLAVGESATIGRFVLTVDEVVQDGDDIIADAMAGNPPAAGQYVVVDLTVLYEGRGKAEPFVDLQSNFVEADGTEHAYYECATTTAEPGYLAPSLRAGDSASYQICYDVPPAAVTDGHLAFFDLADYGSSTVDWALE